MDKFFSFLESIVIGLFKFICTVMICATILIIVFTLVS